MPATAAALGRSLSSSLHGRARLALLAYVAAVALPLLLDDALLVTARVLGDHAEILSQGAPYTCVASVPAQAQRS